MSKQILQQRSSDNQKERCPAAADGLHCPLLTNHLHLSQINNPLSFDRHPPRPSFPFCEPPPIVLTPSGSTIRARCSASLLARSWLAGVTARMMQLG